jgi:hypothetical protein
MELQIEDTEARSARIGWLFLESPSIHHHFPPNFI